MDESRLPPGADIDFARTSTFVRCSTLNMNVGGQSRVWAPIVGANVEMLNFRNYRGAATDIHGYFETAVWWRWQQGY